MVLNTLKEKFPLSLGAATWPARCRRAHLCFLSVGAEHRMILLSPQSALARGDRTLLSPPTWAKKT